MTSGTRPLRWRWPGSWPDYTHTRKGELRYLFIMRVTYWRLVILFCSLQQVRPQKKQGTDQVLLRAAPCDVNRKPRRWAEISFFAAAVTRSSKSTTQDMTSGHQWLCRGDALACAALIPRCCVASSANIGHVLLFFSGEWSLISLDGQRRANALTEHFV